MRRLRRLWRNFGIRAARVDIRSHAAWYAYAALGAAVTLAGVLLFYGLWKSLRSPEEQNVESLRARLEELEVRATQDDGVLASNLEMTHSANRQLAGELRVLSDEQTVLKDDLAYFLRLVPVGTREGEVRLDRFVLWPEAAADSGAARRYRYSVLVGYHTGRQTGEFAGTLKFVLTVVHEGQTLQRILPADAKMAAQPEYQVRTHQWVRKEGVLEIAPGDVLKKAELRLVQANRARAVASVTF
ncbi:MAG: hypothetical protein LBQ81_14355 [Zoogloeaceae bacterium]|jgi:hypothetical protein|nr:hypothetical protein [Zoogloeaceae bacterium]